MKRGSRLVYRLYAVGLAQLALVVLSAILIGYAMMRSSPHRDLRTALTRIERVAADPKQRAHEFARLRKRDGLKLSLYDADRRLLATNVTPALPFPSWEGRNPDEGHAELPRHGFDPGRHGAPPFPLVPFGALPPGEPPDQGAPPHDHGPPPLFLGPHRDHPQPPDFYIKLKLGDGEGTLVARLELPKPSPVPAVLTLCFGLIVFGIGAFLTARWIVRPLEQLARTAGALGAGDLRARTALARDDEIGQVGRAFDEMAERIQALMHAERELLANVSHELRTPLARIHVALDVAAEGDTEAARASLAEIAVDLAELETLVDDVLTATRLELAAGRAPGFALHREEIAPRTLCERAAERFANRKARRVELTVAGELPLIEVDPMLFRRVLDNLLENADKYTPDPAHAIALRVKASGATVEFEVEDHGLGIPDDDLPRVFEPFFRGERSRSRGTGGVGLGLTLARRIVEAHGGEIAVTSAPGEGTTVRIAIPVRAESAAP